MIDRVGALPGVRALRAYRATDLRRDVVAGIVLTGLLIPAGMGYARLSGLPEVTGLHATIVGLLAYALVGPSRVLVVGPDSALAPIIAAAIIPLAAGDPDRAVALAGLLAILMGAVLLVAGALRLGLIADLLSKPIRIGYLNGVALIIALAQLPAVLGLADGFGSLLSPGSGSLGAVVDRPTAALGVGALAVGGGIRRIARRTRRPLPGLLIAMLGATAAVALLDMDVEVVGSLPQGLPAPALGGVSWADALALLPAAVALALVGFADTGVLSRTFAMRSGEDVDGNHEMAAIGATNVAVGALGGFAVAGSSSRTPVAIDSGARTQVTGVVGAALVALAATLLPDLTRHLPTAALAAVVVVAASAMVDVRSLPPLWRASRVELAVCLVTTLGVVLVGVLPGVGVAVALSLLAFVARAWSPYATELVRITGRKGYHDVGRHPSGRRIPGLVIARFDAPLFFANVGVFDRFVMDLVDAADPPARWVVLAAEPMTDVDATGADALVGLDDRLTARGVRLVFAGMKGPVKDRLVRHGLHNRFPPDRQYPTLGTAVSAYRRATGVVWRDWTDRADDPSDTA